MIARRGPGQLKGKSLTGFSHTDGFIFDLRHNSQTGSANSRPHVFSICFSGLPWFNSFVRIFLRTLPLLLFIPLLVGCTLPGVEEGERAELYVRTIEGEVFDSAPLRDVGEMLRFNRGSFAFRCSECHTDFDSLPTANNPQGEHAAIMARFNHGRNLYCLNCHNQTNRNSFVDDIGREIPGDQSGRLCSKCHGPMYRDWEEGIHGRQDGHWDAKFGVRTKLQCIQCHDPHLPGFPLMAPDPAPAPTRFSTGEGAHVQ